MTLRNELSEKAESIAFDSKTFFFTINGTFNVGRIVVNNLYGSPSGGGGGLLDSAVDTATDVVSSIF